MANSLKKSDYMYYFSVGTKSIIHDSYINKSKFDLKSITKIFLIFVLIYLKIDFNSYITSYFHNYKHKIKIIDIVNHTSGLVNDWMIFDEIKKQWIQSDLIKKYFSSKNIYKFALNLDIIKSDYGKFKYNNYSYNILAAIVLKITGKTWINTLSKIFPLAKFSTHKAYNKLPFTSHSLFIYKKDIPYISNIILKLKFHSKLNKYKLIPRTLGHYKKIIKGIIFSGHDGSGGQYLVFNNNEIFWSLAYDNPDIHTRGLSWDEMVKTLKNIRKIK